MGSSEIRKFINIEHLLLRIKKSKIRWFGHVCKIHQERLPKQVLLVKTIRNDQLVDLEQDEQIILDFGRNRLGFHLSGMMQVMEGRELWRLNLELCPRKPHGKASNKQREREMLFSNYCIITAICLAICLNFFLKFC